MGGAAATERSDLSLTIGADGKVRGDVKRTEGFAQPGGRFLCLEFSRVVLPLGERTSISWPTLS